MKHLSTLISQSVAARQRISMMPTYADGGYGYINKMPILCTEI